MYIGFFDGTYPMFLLHFLGQKIKIEMVFNELHIFENVKTEVEVGKNANIWVDYFSQE